MANFLDVSKEGKMFFSSTRFFYKLTKNRQMKRETQKGGYKRHYVGMGTGKIPVNSTVC